MTAGFTRLLLAIATAALTLTGAGAAHAARQVFEPGMDVDGRQLVLHGSGTAYYARIFRVYDAALYAAPGTPMSDLVTGRAPRCLLIEYRRDVTRELIVTTALTVLERQGIALTPLRARLEQLHGAYQDVGAGDRYALCHTPGGATRLSLNGVELARISGDDFAAAYFGIWLRDGAISEELRATLLATGGSPAS